MPSRRSRVRGLPTPEPASGDTPPPERDEEPGLAAATAPQVAATPEPPAVEVGEGPVDHIRRQEAARYATAPRSPRTMRVYDPLYDRLTELVRALDDEGYRTDRTEIIHALLHFELPEDAHGVRKLVRRWRRLLAG